MKTLKLSYSIISQWKEGKYEEAIGQYLGKPFPATPAMELGSLYDKKWEKQILETGLLPDELGGGKLNNPRVQIKYQAHIPFSEEYEILLRGLPDLMEDDMITDFKCGRTDAGSYLGKMQLDYYSIFNPAASVGRYIAYNPYRKTKTVSIKFLSQKNRDDALNEIVTYGAEILDYLLANKLFKDYKEDK